jgi:hypothetical protein
LSRLLVSIVSATLAMVLCAMAVGLGTQGSIEAAVCGPSWSTVPSPSQVESPHAIAAIAPDDIWAVGYNSIKPAERPPHIATVSEHWDGNSWTEFPTPDPSDNENALLGADALSRTDVWAVGYTGKGGTEGATAFKTLAERWNGTQWNLVQSPNVGTGSNTLTDVDATAPNRAWAVGYYREGTLRKTLIQRWNGTSWSVISSPNPGSLSNALLGVAAISASNIWAVGYKSSGAGYRSLVLHYDGSAWREVDVPTTGNADNILTSISAVAGNDIWAAGYFVSGPQHKALTLHYNGSAWNLVPAANDGDGVTILRGIRAFSPTNAWAVGEKYLTDRDNYAAATQHWDGSAWSAFPAAISQASTARSEMFDVEKAPGTEQVWAVGMPANVETICLSGSQAAAAPAESSTTALGASRASEQPGAPSHTEPSAASTAPNRAVGTVSAVDKAVTAVATVSAVDKARDAGIYELTKTRGAVITDFNNDQHLDVFLNRHQNVARLYINDGNGHFSETNQGTFRQIDRHGCDAADVSGDPLKDIFCVTSAARGTLLKQDELYIQRADHTFVNRTAQYGVLEPLARGRSATFINANGDAYLDLFVANEPDRGDGLPSPNRLFINEGGNAYGYAPESGLELEVGDGPSSGGNPDAGDLDKDGWQDLLAESSTGLRVYHNNRGNGFTNVAASVGLGQRPVDSVLSDVNGDTWLDVIEVSRNELRVLLNTNGTFSSAFSTNLQGAMAVAAGDVNDDNRPDIYVMRGSSGTSTNAADRVYLNSGTGKNFTQMSSIPSTSQGQAESVWPIDYDGNGLTDFLALNGNAQSAGPVQLIAFFRAP